MIPTPILIGYFSRTARIRFGLFNRIRVQFRSTYTQQIKLQMLVKRWSWSVKSTTPNLLELWYIGSTKGDTRVLSWDERDNYHAMCQKLGPRGTAFSISTVTETSKRRDGSPPSKALAPHTLHMEPHVITLISFFSLFILLLC